MNNQPDFQRLEQGVNTVVAELGKIPNMPVLDLAAQLRTMQENMAAQFRTIQDQFTAMQATMNQTMKSPATGRDFYKVVSSEFNNFARTYNARIYEASARLEPLRGIHNKPIPGFPRTPREITELGDGDINRLLSALGLPWEEGTLVEKKDRFNIYIGLSALA
ncbi:hypothetical protein BDZ91DRAFT_719978 [Kalaharituber pfeilii]|nr:hypothetical protein BDZ91DRAFT_719978 [Kalaharituber pfeilii]